MTACRINLGNLPTAVSIHSAMPTTNQPSTPLPEISIEISWAGRPAVVRASGFETLEELEDALAQIVVTGAITRAAKSTSPTETEAVPSDRAGQ